MVKKLDRNKLRQKKHRSIRKKIVGTAERPRLAVYRSLQNIFVQVIDDTTGNTLVSASTIEKGAKITDGPVSPHDILKIKGHVEAQQFILESVQQVYREQGVAVNDKHIEIIVKQMFQKIKIKEAGDSLFLEDELIDKKIVKDMYEMELCSNRKDHEEKYIFFYRGCPIRISSNINRVLFRKIASKRMRINSKDISFISSCNNRFRLYFLDGRNIILE